VNVTDIAANIAEIYRVVCNQANWLCVQAVKQTKVKFTNFLSLSFQF